MRIALTGEHASSLAAQGGVDAGGQHACVAHVARSLARSWMVGDIRIDVEAGHRAGCRGALLDVGRETPWPFTPLRRPVHRAKDLFDAARFILGSEDMAWNTGPAPMGVVATAQTMEVAP
jgi:hypothetical protein